MKNPYSKEISTNGSLDAAKVLVKMNKLKAAHIDELNSRKYKASHFTPEFIVSSSINSAFNYGRDLIGFDMAEAWRIGATSEKSKL